MDCNFTVCSVRDTKDAAIAKLMQDHSSHAIVADESNVYRGVVTLCGLLQNRDQNSSIEDLVHEVEPVLESGHITALRQTNLDVLPVVNSDYNVVGVISLRSMIEYLPDALSYSEAGRTAGSRKVAQLSAKYSINDIVGQSKSILLMKEQIIAAAKTRSTVMLLGETGTGKEYAAHAIHRLSSRRHNAFVRVNCAAIPDNLLESELFGYEPGAFTGAVKSGHMGKFEIADGGTIFLDEIGDMPLSLQSKILRVLQEKEIEKVGGRSPIPIDVRVIAATHRNLRELVKENKFRSDLYYRLHVIPIQLPALREHREDIPVLVDHFLEKHADEIGVPKPRVERDFMSALIEYDWPGNVRELSNAIEQAINLSHGTITVSHLTDNIVAEQASRNSEGDSTVLRSHADEAEKEAILRALEVYDWNKIKVSDALGISRSSLYNKLKKYKIEG